MGWGARARVRLRVRLRLRLRLRVGRAWPARETSCASIAADFLSAGVKGASCRLTHWSRHGTARVWIRVQG